MHMDFELIRKSIAWYGVYSVLHNLCTWQHRFRTINSQWAQVVSKRTGIARKEHVESDTQGRPCVW